MKQQAASQLVKCDICGKQVRARGLKSHVRLLHKMKVETQVVTEVIEKTYTPEKGKEKIFREQKYNWPWLMYSTLKGWNVRVPKGHHNFVIQSVNTMDEAINLLKSHGVVTQDATYGD